MYAIIKQVKSGATVSRFDSPGRADSAAAGSTFVPVQSRFASSAHLRPGGSAETTLVLRRGEIATVALLSGVFPVEVCRLPAEAELQLPPA